MSGEVSTVGRDVAEYDGIKYSLQPHGLKSKLLIAFSFFVVAFGGALLAASPAQGAEPTPSPGQVDCSIWLSIPPDPSPTPSPNPSPTTCPTVTVPGPVMTVTVTKTIIKTVYVDHTATETVTETISPSPTPSSAASETPHPSRTPDPSVLPVANSGDISDLVPWGIGVAVVGGAALTVVGLVGIVRRRRYKGTHQAEEYGVEDYDPADGDYDPALGGYAGESNTLEMPRVEDDPGSETQVIPPVK